LRLWPFWGAIAHSFGVPVWFTRPMTLSIVLRAWPKTHRFYVLGPFLWAIVHCFGVLGDLHEIWHSVHIREGWQKNSSFLHFTAVFVSYCPQFWGSEVIYKVPDTQYMY
jgi:hypothetical protein